jgi:2-oxoisovalerate dehydrogenase E1 component
MFDRSLILHEKFLNYVAKQHLPDTNTQFNTTLSQQAILSLFDSQLASRHIDLHARQLKQAGKGFYTIASCGHEGNAAIARAFQYTDLAFLHYRVLPATMRDRASFD